MLFTAPDGWGYFWAEGIICSTIGKISCKKCPTSRMGEDKGIFHKWFCPKSRMGEEVKKINNPNHQMLFTAPGVGVIFGAGA